MNRDALRLALGTLTAFPVRPPRTVDAPVAGRAMVLAPLAGTALAVAVLVPLVLASQVETIGDSPLLLAVLVTGALALLTRGMHLDGLADVADGFGSGRRRVEAIAIMRQSDIGPFGVVTLVVALGLQVAALAELLAADRTLAIAGLLVALVVSRTLLALLCTTLLPPASPTGLGRTMAGSVRPVGLAASAVLGLAMIAAGTTLTALLASRLDGFGVPDSTTYAVLGLGLSGVVAALALAMRCRSRLGGATGDVYGACVETAYTAILVVVALAS